jgi:hypothetical protein
MEPIVVKAVETAPKEAAFHFKKEKIKDADGKVIGEGKKLPSIKTNLPVPTAKGILDIVEAQGKELELLQDACFDVVYAQARTLIDKLRDKNPEAEIKPEDIDQSQLLWSVIANMPKAQRRGLGIAEEDWDDFAADYRAIMPGATGKDKDRIEKHIQLFKKKYQQCRNDKKALGVLQEMLQLWAATTSAMEDNENVYEYLKSRVETLLQEDEKVLAEAL